MSVFTPNTLVAGRYKIAYELGSGGMGTVFKAIDLELNRTVALKILHKTRIAGTHSLERFEREGKVLSLLNDSHIVSLYQADFCNGDTPYLVMELVEGPSLRWVLQAEHTLAWPRAVRLGLQISEGLAAAHAAGIIHRDLKPDNLLIAGEDLVKIADFGLCKIQTADGKGAKTLSGDLIGSLHYMAPEIATGTFTTSADIYALGCVLHEMLTGSPPFQADTPPALLWQHCNERPPHLSDKCPAYSWPLALENLLQRCLLKDASSRPSAEVIRDYLASIYSKAEDTAAVSLAPPEDQAPHKSRKKPLRALLPIAGVALLALVAGLYTWLPSVSAQKFLLRNLARFVSEQQALTEISAELNRVGKNEKEFAELCDFTLNNVPTKWSQRSRILCYLALHKAALSVNDRERAQQTALSAFQEQARFLSQANNYHHAPPAIQLEVVQIAMYLTNAKFDKQTWRTIANACRSFLSSNVLHPVPLQGNNELVLLRYHGNMLYAQALERQTSGKTKTIYDDRELGSTLLQAAYARELQGDANDACSLLQDAIQAFRRGQSLTEWECTVRYARLLLARNNFSSFAKILPAIRHYLDVLDEQDLYSANSAGVELASIVSDFYFCTGDYENVVELLLPNLTDMEKLALAESDTDHGYANCCANLALSLYRLGDRELAKQLANRLTRLESAHDWWHSAQFVNSLIMNKKEFSTFYDRYGDKPCDVRLAWGLSYDGLYEDLLVFCDRIRQPAAWSPGEPIIASTTRGGMQCQWRDASLYRAYALLKHARTPDAQTTAITSLSAGLIELEKAIDGSEQVTLPIDPLYWFELKKELDKLPSSIRDTPPCVEVQRLVHVAMNRQQLKTPQKNVPPNLWRWRTQWENYLAGTRRLPYPIMKPPGDQLLRAETALKVGAFVRGITLLESCSKQSSTADKELFASCCRLLVDRCWEAPPPPDQSFRLSKTDNFFRSLTAASLPASKNNLFRVECCHAIACAVLDPVEAEMILQKSETIANTLSPEERSDRVGETCFAIAYQYSNRGRWSDSLRMAAKTVAIETSVHHQQNNFTTGSHEIIARALLTQGKLDQAESELRQTGQQADLNRLSEDWTALASSFRSKGRESNAIACEKLARRCHSEHQ